MGRRLNVGLLAGPLVMLIACFGIAWLTPVSAVAAPRISDRSYRAETAPVQKYLCEETVGGFYTEYDLNVPHDGKCKPHAKHITFDQFMGLLGAPPNSFKRETGPAGPQGPPGVAGPAGPAGPQGIAGAV